jgi:hypothetical protein
MASTTYTRATGLATEDVTVDGETLSAVKDFAIFIDTHRDQPHVGSFDDDVHRGTCKPTLVHLLAPDPAAMTGKLTDWTLWNAQTGQRLPLHEKHKFVSLDWWTKYLAEYIQDNGELPFDGKGFMPTSHLRDARAGTYKLRSFRQIVVERSLKP